MKYGASSYIWVSPFSNKNMEQQLQHAHGLGFDIYEIGVEAPEEIQIERVREISDQLGIQVNICGAFGEERDISSDNQAFRDTGLNYIKQLIDMAAVTNSPYVAGPMYAATGRTRLAGAEEKTRQLQYAVKYLRELGYYAGEKGVKLALEPLNRFETDFMNTVEQGMAVIDQTGLDNIGFLLDTFHMNIEEKSIPDAIQLAGDKIYDFHACSNDRGTPGEDHLAWDDIRSALEQVHYQGPIVIESFTTEITEIARAVSLWRPLANSQDELAGNGLRFLKQLFEVS